MEACRKKRYCFLFHYCSSAKAPVLLLAQLSLVTCPDSKREDEVIIGSECHIIATTKKKGERFEIFATIRKYDIRK